MSWTTDKSPTEDVAFERAWGALNEALDRRVRVSVQMRITACVFDALGFVTLLRDLEAAEIARSEKLVNAVRYWEWDKQKSFQFAAALKAMYYFLRALQDSVYVALVEATSGSPAKARLSMQRATKANDSVKPLIEQALPEYFAWFADFRNIRNRMKLGASTAFVFRGTVAGSTETRVILQNVDDVRRHVTSGRELSLDDVASGLMQSSRLMQFAADHVSNLPQARR